jgi:hypothetical protein
MWTLALKCDGCGEILACSDAPHVGRVKLVDGVPIICSEGRRPELRCVAGDLKRYAGTRGWERSLTPDDGEAWFCCTCRLARGDGPVAVAATV